MRQSMFPTRAPKPIHVVSSDCILPMIEVRHPMTPAGGAAEHSEPRGSQNRAASVRNPDSPGGEMPPAMTPNTRGAERVAVEDWCHGGRPSDMV